VEYAGSSLIGGGCTRAWPLRRSRSRPISAPWWMCSTAMPRTSRRLGRCGRSGPGAARRDDVVEPVDRPREAVLGRVDPLVECVPGTWYRELRQAEALVLEGPVPVHLGARRKMCDPPRDRGEEAGGKVASSGWPAAQRPPCSWAPAAWPSESHPLGVDGRSPAGSSLVPACSRRLTPWRPMGVGIQPSPTN
jgi:hypothetical protein